jgi:hypothetical protein
MLVASDYLMSGVAIASLHVVVPDVPTLAARFKIDAPPYPLD